MKNRWAIVAAGVALLVGGVGHLRADLISHNGNSDNPTPDFRTGEGFVDVGLIAASDFSFVIKIFGEDFVSGSQVHELTYEFESGQPPVSVGGESVFNRTQDVWSGFIIHLQGDFFREDPEGGDPIRVDAGLISISDVGYIVPAGEEGPDPGDVTISVTRGDLFAEIELSFGGGGMAPDEAFGLTYIIGLLEGNPDLRFGFSGFTMEEKPLVIPVPGAASLAALGLCCIGWVRRRSAYGGG